MSNFELTTSTDLDFATLATTTMSRDRRGENAYDRDALSIEFVRSLVAQGKVAPASVRVRPRACGHRVMAPPPRQFAPRTPLAQRRHRAARERAPRRP